MSEVDVLPLALLYADGQREIRGITRFQKLIFLAQEETSVNQQYQFAPEKYGPFSHELYDALEQLENEGMVSERTEMTPAGNETYIYSLTDRGRDLVKHVRDSGEYDFNNLFEVAERVRQQYGGKSLNQLLRYVYDSHPEYAENSELDLGTV